MRNKIPFLDTISQFGSVISKTKFLKLCWRNCKSIFLENLNQRGYDNQNDFRKISYCKKLHLAGNDADTKLGLASIFIKK